MKLGQYPELRAKGPRPARVVCTVGEARERWIGRVLAVRAARGDS